MAFRILPALVLVALLGLQVDVDGQLLSTLAQLRRNTIARLAAAGSSGMTATARIGNNAVKAAEDTFNTTVDAGSNLTRSFNSLGARRLNSLADTGSTVATFSQTLVKTGVRTAQDVINTGLELAGRAVNRTSALLPLPIGIGARLANRGLNAAGRANNATADFLADLEDAETKVVQDLLHGAADLASNASQRLDTRIAGRADLAKNLFNSGANGARSVIDGLTAAGVQAMQHITDHVTDGTQAQAATTTTQ